MFQADMGGLTSNRTDGMNQFLSHSGCNWFSWEISFDTSSLQMGQYNFFLFPNCICQSAYKHLLIKYIMALNKYLPIKHSSIRSISLDMCGNVYRCKGVHFFWIKVYTVRSKWFWGCLNDFFWSVKNCVSDQWHSHISHLSC